MFHSLRARLIVMTLVVAVIAVVCVGLLSRSMTLLEFRTYITNKGDTELEPLRAQLVEHYRQQGSWKDVQPLLGRLAATTGKRLILVDPERKVIAKAPLQSSQDEIIITPTHDLTWRRKQLQNGVVVADEMVLKNVPNVQLADSRGIVVGAVYVAPPPLEPKRRPEEAFVRALNRTLLLAALISAAVALLFAIVLSRRILRPVAALTAAVRRMENGELSQRVDATSKDEIGELGRSFNSMADSLTRAEQLRRNMVNDVAHELRTPLTNIRCQIETMQDGLAEPTPAVIDSLHEEAMLLHHLIDDLQDLSLADAGQLSHHPHSIGVKAAVTLAVNSMQPRVRDAGISMKIGIPEDCPDVLADSKRLGQVLRNLLSNAISHTPRGGLIEISGSPAGSYVELSVADTGSGIPRADQSLVFERFYRTDASRNRATGGAGLGLAIVKQIVEAHGGKIHLQSEVGKGTTVRFTLPTVTL
ncbi:MAG: ATP-binding protein [bacterium]